MNEEPSFENYKQRQRYYDEKFKNRGTLFFAQQPKAKIYGNEKVARIKPKGRTYRKEK